MKRAAHQMELAVTRRRGGARPGAGRKARGPRPLVSHKPRARFEKPTPVHVTLRVREHVWNLRSGRSYRRIRLAFEKARGRFGVRLIHFSIQGNHLHLIVEADSTKALSRGLQGLCIRIAKALNAMMELAGRVFSDHYWSRLLRTPTELVNAIRYVLGNSQHHYGEKGVDRFSSAALPEEPRDNVLATPVGWLLRVGWKRARTAAAGAGEGDSVRRYGAVRIFS
jgi:putative transposase